MDVDWFDNVTRCAGSIGTRRSLLKGLGGGALAALVGRSGREAAAAGCTKVGKPCRRGAQCCSGVCKGPQGKKTCRGHDAGTCKAGQDSCAQGVILCNGAVNCACRVTTGGARICATLNSVCQSCERDIECEAGFGPGAACVRSGTGICACGGNGNACVGRCATPKP